MLTTLRVCGTRTGLRACLASAAFVLVFATLAVRAALGAVEIDIYGPNENIVNLGLADALGPEPGKAATNLGPKLNKAIRENLAFLPFMRLVRPEAVPGGSVLATWKAPGIDFKRFQLAAADLLITAGWPGGDGENATAELRLYETFSGKFLFGNAYSGITEAGLQDVADRFCADLMKALTGHGDFFLSTLAVVKSGKGRHRKDIWTVKPTGRNLRRITDLPGTAMSPSWSPDGRFVVFSHMDDRTHALGVWDRSTNQVQRVRFPGNTVIGPTFMPDNRVAVSLSTGKYPDIYLLSRTFRRERTLESSPAINVSPSFDATGTKMAFTSSRHGGPQIFLKDLTTGAVTRVSRQGAYNSEPSLSPDGTLVAFSRLTDNGHRIFVQDLLTGIERQVSFGPGNDEQPAFAPDSYFLAFSSTRGGKRQVYLTTRHGGDPKLVPTGSGDAAFPRWGLTAPRK